MNEHVTFAQLELLLSELGFEKSIVPEKGIAYTHAPTRAMLVVRQHKPKDFVPDYALFGVRHDLQVYGIMDPTEFDERLKAVAA